MTVHLLYSLFFKVLQDGEIVEYGIPFELLQNSQSVLSWFVNQTGSTSAEKLKETVLNHNYYLPQL